jgi:hypothetical protein
MICMNHHFIYENKNAISHELCDKIIMYYHNSSNKHVGVTHSGINKSIKDTTDLVIPLNTNLDKGSIWVDINNLCIEIIMQ